VNGAAGPPTIALPADLMFGSRIRGAAAAAGAHVVLARSPADLLLRVAGTPDARVLLDLETSGLDVAATVEALRESGAYVVAFVSHTRADLIEIARTAGAQRVLARSALVRELPVLFGADASPGA
jgi:CheY-like chemotaxis protein